MSFASVCSVAVLQESSYHRVITKVGNNSYILHFCGEKLVRNEAYFVFPEFTFLCSTPTRYLAATE